MAVMSDIVGEMSGIAFVLSRKQYCDIIYTGYDVINIKGVISYI